MRGKSGPRKGHLKALYERLAQMENVVNDPEHANKEDGFQFTSSLENSAIRQRQQAVLRGKHQRATPIPRAKSPASVQEEIPSSADAARLDKLFFEKVYPFSPVIHKPSYEQALSLASEVIPLKGLRLSMWALAAAHDPAFHDLQEDFYRRARRSLQADEPELEDELLTLEHCQAWLFVAIYEFKIVEMNRAWMSTGHAVRIAQMLGLERLDGKPGLLVKASLPPATNATEQEVRRRTFWQVFWADRCCSLGLGWPVAISEQNISTRLPGSELDFQNGSTSTAPTLEEVLSAKAPDYSPIAGAMTVLALHGRALDHLQRPLNGDERNDITSAFWKRFRELDLMHAQFAIGMPSHLRLKQNLRDPTIVYVHMAYHVSVISLHQAAISHANEAALFLPSRLNEESLLRSMSSAMEIASIMRAIAHVDISTLSPFHCFPLYVASRVMLQHLQHIGEDDDDVAACLNFLVTALQAFVKSNRNAYVYLTLLLDDIQASGVGDASQWYEARQKADLMDPHASIEGNNTSSSGAEERVFDPMAIFSPQQRNTPSQPESPSHLKEADRTSWLASLLEDSSQPGQYEYGAFAANATQLNFTLSQLKNDQNPNQEQRGDLYQPSTFQSIGQTDWANDVNLEADSSLFDIYNQDNTAWDTSLEPWSFPQMAQFPFDWTVPTQERKEHQARNLS